MTAIFTHSIFRPCRSLTFGSLAALSLGACNGRLDVTDENIGGTGGTSDQTDNGSAGSPGSAGSSGSGGETAMCRDGVLNGDEADIDCGGASCPVCPGDVQPCSNGLVECNSHVCIDGLCQPPTCEDGVRNGDEEGVDCGGTSNCGPCLTLCHEQCAASDALIAIGCDPNGSTPAGVASIPRSNDDGTRIAFDLCDGDSQCRTLYWSAAEGVRTFPVTGGSTVAGMSDDGQVVLVSPQVALGGQTLLFAPDGTSTPTGMARSPALLTANGALVGVSPPTTDPFSLLRRPRGGEIEPLGELPLGSDAIALVGATPDASVIIGYADGNQPFRYTEDGGLVFGLEGLPEPADGASVHALSRDGRALAGITLLGNERQNIFRWTEADGVVELGPIPPATPGVDPGAMALSDDGSVLVFSRETDAVSGDFSAFRWTPQNGSEALTPGIQSVATHVSADGGVIIGQSFDVPNDYGPYVWTPAGGARSIRAALETAGVDLRGWSFYRPWSLSRDGKVALGVGRCGEITTVYRMVLPE